MIRKHAVSALLLATLLAQGIITYRSREWRETRRGAEQASRAVQLALLDSATVPWLHVQGGDSVSLSSLRGPYRDVAFLAYSNHCQWCDSIAATWQRDLALQSTVTRVVLVTMTPDSLARRYAREKGWKADVIAIDSARATLLERAMVARTPWITVIDAAGHRRADMHGANLRELLVGRGE